MHEKPLQLIHTYINTSLMENNGPKIIACTLTFVAFYDIYSVYVKSCIFTCRRTCAHLRCPLFLFFIWVFKFHFSLNIIAITRIVYSVLFVLAIIKRQVLLMELPEDPHANYGLDRRYGSTCCASIASLPI